MLYLYLIELKLKAKSSQEVIEKLGNLMLSKGYVLDSYVDAVLTREETLPTGLPIDGFSVAIPHTDSGHVNESTIAIATLEEPVEFNMMIDPTQKTKVQLALMSVFQNKELLMNLQKASSKEEVNELLHCLAV